MVRPMRLELTRDTPLPPQSSVSAYSTTASLPEYSTIRKTKIKEKKKIRRDLPLPYLLF